MNHFVILYHQMPPTDVRASHWDFMLRESDQLLTWALDQNPLQHRQVLGHKLPNHSIKYLNFQGLLDNNRGTIHQLATGFYRWIQRQDDEHWEIVLLLACGQRMRCCQIAGRFEFSPD